jgi:hypothetical protein
MILLTNVSALVQIVTGGTQVVQVQASYIDQASGTFTPGALNTSISTATTTTVVPSPASSTQRNIKFISVFNSDSTNSTSITVQHTDGTTLVNLVKLTLQAGWCLTYNDLDGWVLIDSSGGRYETPLAGRFLKRSVLTTSGTFTATAQTNTVILRGVGGGGGGGGCTSVAAAAAAAGGGGAGSYLEKTSAVSPNTGYTYTIGTAGAGASGAAGTNGGNGTFIIGATTYTVTGGTGAAVGTAATTLTADVGGAGGTVSTNGDLNSGGQPGANGLVLIATGPIAASGAGGSSPFGSGGVGINAVGNGVAGLGFGAGGGGSMTGASAVRTGGNGTAGCWVVEEYS